MVVSHNHYHADAKKIIKTKPNRQYINKNISSVLTKEELMSIWSTEKKKIFRRLSHSHKPTAQIYYNPALIQRDFVKCLKHSSTCTADIRHHLLSIFNPSYTQKHILKMYIRDSTYTLEHNADSLLTFSLCVSLQAPGVIISVWYGLYTLWSMFS